MIYVGLISDLMDHFIFRF